MSGVIQPDETETHSNQSFQARLRAKAKRYTNKVTTKPRSLLSRRKPSSSDLRESNDMSRQLASSKTHAGRDRNPKGLSEGTFKLNINKMSLSVHSSDASFRNRSLMSGRNDLLGNTTHSDHRFFPNAIEGASGIKMIDTAQSFHDESGLVVPPKGTSDSLEGPKTPTSPSGSDTSPGSNQSRRDSDPKTDSSSKTDVGINRHGFQVGMLGCH